MLASLLRSQGADAVSISSALQGSPCAAGGDGETPPSLRQRSSASGSVTAAATATAAPGRSIRWVERPSSALSAAAFRSSLTYSEDLSCRRSYENPGLLPGMVESQGGASAAQDSGSESERSSTASLSGVRPHLARHSGESSLSRSGSLKSMMDVLQQTSRRSSFATAVGDKGARLSLDTHSRLSGLNSARQTKSFDISQADYAASMVRAPIVRLFSEFLFHYHCFIWLVTES